MPLLRFPSLLLLICVCAPAAAVADPLFDLPVACTIGESCFVQNYVDDDPGSGAKDFSCGYLTYDDHRGTDIRLPSYVEMDKGVAVIAAAPGKVLRLRDGMDDVSVAEIGAAAVKDRMAGNSVIVDHGDGWVTQYAHMKKGSVVVQPGQDVKAGDKLGLVGLSGNTEFPHLHFEVRHNDVPIDPFTGEDATHTCGGATDKTLWQPAVAKSLAYRPTGLLAMGTATEAPKAEAARHGRYAARPTLDSPALVFWADFFGLQAGDQVEQTVTGPAGDVVAQGATTIERPKAAYFSFVGKKKPASGWIAGTYTGHFRILRNGAPVIDRSTTVELSAP